MKLIRRILLALLLILGLAALGLVITGHSYLFKGVWATYLHGEPTTSIGDAQFFDVTTIPADSPEQWPFSNKFNQITLTDTLRKSLENTETAAFLVVKSDSILYEEYWYEFDENTRSNSFSMAKSITTLLAQKAIQDGYIKSWDDKVIDYLPEVKGPFREDLKLKHLATMSAGLNWDESYTAPFGILARAYYASDIPKAMYQYVDVVEEPGEKYEYQSGCHQWLGMIVAKATGKSYSDYFKEVFWDGLHAEKDATWHLDSEGGTEITYCCLNTNARDFARFGKLLLNDGNWNGVQIIDSAFVDKATHAALVPHYGWSFWIYDDFDIHTYFFRGMHGQYIIVIPDYDLVICRLGHAYIKGSSNVPEDFKVIVKELVKELG